MPNDVDQITKEDFKAPQRGMYRIMREDLSDGELSIVADFHQIGFAELTLETLRTHQPENVFTLCDENGPREI